MKKRKLRTWVYVAIVVICFMIGIYIDHNYTRKNCIITDISNGLITIEDSNGYIWVALDNGEFAVNDMVDLKMNDNCTANIISDDIIKDITIVKR